MEIKDSGVLKNSFLDINTPSSFAKKSLFYTAEFGHFLCNDKYHVKRNYLDIFLLFYVIEGKLDFFTNNKKYTAEKNEIVILDCREPHSYKATGFTNFIWFHFHGASSEEYIKYIRNIHNNIVFKVENNDQIIHIFENIIRLSRQDVVNEHQLSVLIHTVLGAIAEKEKDLNIENNPRIKKSIDYIYNHFSEDISIKALADQTYMSKYYFIRTFKRHTGITPHKFLVNYRIRQSKKLLLTTKDSNEEIAIRCGFNSGSHFARSFRKNVGVSPQEFRDTNSLGLL